MAVNNYSGKFELKQIEYQNTSPETENKAKELSVIYLLKTEEKSNKEVCYFSGINTPSSTITSVETIINKICKKEEKNLRDLRFVDVLTFRGVGISAGYVMVQELVILEDKSPQGGLRYNWVPVTCPAEIKKIFMDFARTHK